MDDNDGFVPVSQPNWLVVFNMLLECEAIFNHFQHRPQSPGQWCLLQWANRTVNDLPLLEHEARWASDINIPPFFNYRGHTSDMSYDLFYEIVKYILTCAVLKKTTHNSILHIFFLFRCKLMIHVTIM